MPSMYNFLTGLTIGTTEVPILECGELRPFSSDPQDPRRILAVELVIEDGAALVDDVSGIRDFVASMNMRWSE